MQGQSGPVPVSTFVCQAVMGGSVLLIKYSKLYHSLS